MDIHECIACLLLKDNHLLAEKRELSKTAVPGAIALPGGHVEVGKSPENALYREVRAELGIIPSNVTCVCTLLHRSQEFRNIHYYVVQSLCLLCCGNQPGTHSPLPSSGPWPRGRRLSTCRKGERMKYIKVIIETMLPVPDDAEILTHPEDAIECIKIGEAYFMPAAGLFERTPDGRWVDASAVFDEVVEEFSIQHISAEEFHRAFGEAEDESY